MQKYRRMDYVKYTWDHRKAFLMVEKKIFGKNSFRAYFHDLDKVFLYPLLGKELTTKIHRSFARHHAKNAKSLKDMQMMICDWESARYTKPDKPLDAYETLFAYYPHLADKVLPLLREYGLVGDHEKS